MDDRVTISRGALEEFAQWSKKSKKHAWRWYKDETKVRYGAWDNPSDRSLLMRIKTRAITIDLFADFIQKEILTCCENGIDAEQLRERLMEFAEKQRSSKAARKFAELAIKSLKEETFPDEDDLKEAF